VKGFQQLNVVIPFSLCTFPN